MVQCEPDGCAGIDRDARPGDEIVGRELRRRRQRQNGRTTSSEHTAALRFEHRNYEPVLRPRRVLDVEIQRPFDAGDSPKQCRRRAGAQFVAPLVGADGERIHQHRRPGRSAERRLEDHRLGQVPGA